MTDEERAHLNAVIESPDDDLPRLVFADWLDEQDEADRAQFIRLEVAIARAKVPLERVFNTDVRKARSELAGLELERDRLLHRHHHPLRTSALARGLPHWPFPRDQIEPIWERGFVRGVICSGGMWLEYGDDVMRDNPIRDVTLTGSRNLLASVIATDLAKRMCAPSIRIFDDKSLPEFFALRWPSVKGWDLSLLTHTDPMEWP